MFLKKYANQQSPDFSTKNSPIRIAEYLLIYIVFSISDTRYLVKQSQYLGIFICTKDNKKLRRVLGGESVLYLNCRV